MGYFQKSPFQPRPDHAILAQYSGSSSEDEVQTLPSVTGPSTHLPPNLSCLHTEQAFCSLFQFPGQDSMGRWELAGGEGWNRKTGDGVRRLGSGAGFISH